MSTAAEREQAVIQARTAAKDANLSKKLAKKYFAVCGTLHSASLPEIEKQIKALKLELALYQLSISKGSLSQQIAHTEADSFDLLAEEKKRLMLQERLQIKQLERDLQNEQLKRLHRQEYDHLAATILEFPDRASQNAEKAALQSQLDSILDEKRRLDETLDLRLRQFQMLLNTMSSLEDTLEQDESAPTSSTTTSTTSTTSTSTNAMVVDSLPEIESRISIDEAHSAALTHGHHARKQQRDALSSSFKLPANNPT